MPTSATGAGELVSTTAATRPYTVWFDDSNAVQPIRYSLNTLTEELTITGAGSTVVVKNFQSGGGSGDDTLVGGAGNDIIHAGAGDDRATTP